MSSLEQFMVFKEVAETGNITMASKRLHISQPSVSVQIQNLEKEYNAELFNRTNRGVTLTHPGTILYEKVLDILRSIEQAKVEISDYCTHQRALIHVGATLTIGEYLLPKIMGFAFPGEIQPRFNAHIANTRVIAKEVLNQELSIGLIEGPIHEQEEICITKFWSDELVVVTSAEHPWADRVEVTFDELASENMITREKDSGTRRVMEISLENAGFDIDDLNITMELSSTQAIKGTVAAGLGVTILSALTVQDECSRGQLAMLRLKDCLLERPLNVITNCKNTLSPEEEDFLALICNEEVLSSIFPAPFLPSATTTTQSASSNIDFIDMEDKVIMLPNLPLEDAIPNWDDLPKKERIICAILQEYQSQNSAALARYFGISQREVLVMLHDLVDRGIIEGYGGSKNRQYRFVEELRNIA